MNTLEIVRSERPDVTPLDVERRAELRARLLGDERPQAAMPIERQVVDVAVRRESATRFWLSIAAILLVAGCLAAVIVVTTRPDVVVPTAPPASALPIEDSIPRPYSPDTVPVIEAMPDPPIPDPYPDSEIITNEELRDSIQANDDATTTATSDSAPAFTPLLLTDPPEGFSLATARYYPGDGGFGIARYTNPDHSTELQIVNRSFVDYFHRLDELGRRTWEIDGRTVWADGELDGCLPDACSVAVQWDDHTATSVMWVDVNGGELIPEATEDALLELVPQLVADPSGWTPIRQDAQLEPPSAGDEILLMPASETSPHIEGATTWRHGPTGSRVAVLVAPDSSVQVLMLQPAVPGPEPSTRFDDRREIGARVWSADVTGQTALYDVAFPCGYLRLIDGGGGSAQGAWRPTLTSLLEAMSVGDGDVELRLPLGWALIGESFGDVVYEMETTIGAGSSNVPYHVVVRQAPWSTGGAVPDLAMTDAVPVDVLGHEGWVTSDPDDPSIATVAWFDGHTSRTVTISDPRGGPVADAIDPVLGELSTWGTTAVSGWEQRYDVSAPEPEPITMRNGCDPPRLVID